MEFILNNRKYSIINHELFINYLMVDNYFRHNYSKYEYDIRFDFVEPLLDKDKVEFEDILKGTEQLEDLIEQEEINFIPQGLILNQNQNASFNVIYQDLEFDNVNVGEVIPLLIALNSLLTYKPIVTLTQIEEEIENFIGQFRRYNDNI